MFLLESRPSIVEHLDLWMAVWPAETQLRAAGTSIGARVYGATEASGLPRAAFRLVAAFGSFPRAPDGRQLLNHIRNALVPTGACIVTEPALFSPSPDPTESLRALAMAAGFFRVRIMANEGQVTVYELRR